MKVHTINQTVIWLFFAFVSVAGFQCTARTEAQTGVSKRGAVVNNAENFSTETRGPKYQASMSLSEVPNFSSMYSNSVPELAGQHHPVDIGTWFWKLTERKSTV